MRWIPFFILAYLAIAVQVALSGYLNIGSAAPNLVLPAMVFVALNARRDEALLGSLLLGALQDLFTQQPPGLYAFAYGLAGLMVYSVQPAVHKDHPLTHAFVALPVGVLVGLVVMFNDWAYPRLHGLGAGTGVSFNVMLLRACYTAALAPLLLVGLVRMKRLFGFRAARAYA